MRLISRFLLPAPLVFLTISCRISSNINIARGSSENAEISGLFDGRKETVKLADGTVISAKNYKLDDRIRLELEKLMDQGDLYPKPRESPEMKAAVEKGLSWAEALGIYHYSRGGYNDYMAYWGGGDFHWAHGRATKEQIGWLILATISGLNKLPKFQGTVYFGAALSLKEFLPLLKEGQPFYQRNFTSTSLDLAVAEKFSRNNLKKDLGSFIFTIENSATGSDIVPYSYWSEKEVLFSPAHQFRVKSVKLNGEIPIQGGSVPRYEIVLGEY